MVPEEGTKKQLKRYLLAAVGTIRCSRCSKWIVYGMSCTDADFMCYDCIHRPDMVGEFAKWIFPIIKGGFR